MRCACNTGYTGDGYTCTFGPRTWRNETVQLNAGAFSSLVVDPLGVVGIAYQGDSPRGVYFVRRLATGGWTNVETVDSRTNALEPAMVLSNDSYSVAHADFTSLSVVSFRRPMASSSWATEGTVSGPDRLDLAVGGLREHLVHMTRTAGSPGILRFSTRPAGTSSWSTPVTINSSASWIGARVASNVAGELSALFANNADQTLRFAHSSGSGSVWSTVPVTSPGNRAWDFDVAVSESGYTYVAYYSPDGHRLVVETYNLTTRISQMVVDTAPSTTLTQTMSGVSIALDANDFVHLSWLDFTRGPSLRYATNATGTFVPETVTACDDVLGRTSIAVDATGAPHISFPKPSSSFSTLGYAVKR